MNDGRLDPVLTDTGPTTARRVPTSELHHFQGAPAAKRKTARPPSEATKRRYRFIGITLLSKAALSAAIGKSALSL